METKKTSQKNSEHSKENSLPQAKNFLGFVKRLSEFGKEIYEKFHCNFFNFALIITAVFSIVKLILFLHFASNNW